MIDDNQTDAAGAGEDRLTDTEKSQVQGAGAPNLAATFAKHDGQDENNRVDDPAILENAKAGAGAQSDSAIAVSDAVAGAIAADRVDDAEPQGDANVQYTSRIVALRVGRFQFEGGVLTVTPEDADAFEALVVQTSPRTQAAIRKISRESGLVAKPLNLRGKMVRGTDTSTRNTIAPRPSTSQ